MDGKVSLSTMVKMHAISELYYFIRTQLGADRYNYFPIAAITPLLAELFHSILVDNHIPIFTIIEQIECPPAVTNEKPSDHGDLEPEEEEDQVERKPRSVPFPSRSDKPTLKAILKSKLNRLEIPVEDSNDGSDASGSNSPQVSPHDQSSSGNDSPKKRVQFILPENTKPAKKTKQQLTKGSFSKQSLSKPTIVQIEEKHHRKSYSMQLFALSLILSWCAMLAMVGRYVMLHWKNDQLLLSNCVRYEICVLLIINLQSNSISFIWNVLWFTQIGSSRLGMCTILIDLSFSSL